MTVTADVGAIEEESHTKEAKSVVAVTREVAACELKRFANLSFRLRKKCGE